MNDDLPYIAYGSNLQAAQMRARCPDHRALGTAVILDHRLRFVGFSARRGGAIADIVPATSRQVLGMLYQLTADDWSELDRCEGPKYERRTVTVSPLGRTGPLLAIAYRRRDVLETERAPSMPYLEAIIGGCRECGFPLEYINMVRAAVPTPS